MFISLDQYWMGRDKLYPQELTEEIKNNARDLLPRIHALLSDLNWTNKAIVSSGWRPVAINAATKGAAKKSNHTIGKACDLADADGKLKAAIEAKPELLIKHGLFMEDKKSAPTWCHLQTTPTKSGKRIFIA